jgi:hypothetical protein
MNKIRSLSARVRPDLEEMGEPDTGLIFYLVLMILYNVTSTDLLEYFPSLNGVFFLSPKRYSS